MWRARSKEATPRVLMAMVLSVLVLAGNVQAGPFSDEEPVAVGAAEEAAVPAADQAEFQVQAPPAPPVVPADLEVEAADVRDEEEAVALAPKESGKSKPIPAYEQAARKYFEEDLRAMGMPSILHTTQEGYYKAIDEAVIGFPGGGLSHSPFVYYGRMRLSNYDSWTYNLYYRQKRLFEAHKKYQKLVEANRTKRILGVFGSTIESAGREVAAERARLQKAWGYFKPVYEQAKARVANASKDLAHYEPLYQAAQEKLKALGENKNDPRYAIDVQHSLETIKELGPKIKVRQAMVRGLEGLKILFN
ncbi:MAG: N-acetylmuramoyl-L-alanine amidase [Candidatus Ozemobacter sibiricus]|uniref:N-acetylmuramoyl-L-alanine amidase n=1 Tax=Candidatus Ozemobacter sibiricus TaxID=2268124 RepID=A0A367ZL81_9BACT|nr:MAG: N-acetylmuramoyl-L-alanine amidase [Candidatus Ozemobacter sibiricus]